MPICSRHGLHEPRALFFTLLHSHSFMCFALAPAFRLTDWQSFNFCILLFISKLGYFCVMSNSHFSFPLTTTAFHLYYQPLFASVNITPQPFVYIPHQLPLLSHNNFSLLPNSNFSLAQLLTNMFTFYNLFVTYFVYIFTNSL